MRGFSAPICCGRPAARSAAASGQAPEKRRRLDELMSVLQRGDRLVVSELSRLGRSLGQITERWSGRSSTCSSAVAVRRFLEVLDRRLHLVGVPRWPVGVAGQPRYSDLAAGGDQPEDRTLRTVVVAQGQEPHRLADRWQLVFHPSRLASLSTAADVSSSVFSSAWSNLQPDRGGLAHVRAVRTGLRSPVRMAFARRVLQPDSVRTVRSAANLENLEVGTAS